MAEWPMRTLGSVITTTIDYRGKTPPRSDAGIPTISAKHVKRGRVVHCGTRFVTKETYERWTTRGFIRPGDVLITTEAPVAEVARVPGDRTYLITRRVIALRVDPAECDERFLMYSMLAEHNRTALANLGHGATVPRVFKEDILNFKLPMPDVGVQAKIGAFLGDIDDMIEKNRRRIELLEQMAQAIYREWFVHFRYPGHDDASLVDSPLGPIPIDWRAGSLADLASEVRQSVSPSEETESLAYVPIDVISPRSITLQRTRPGNEAASSLRIFDEGDVLFGAMRAYFHKVCIAPSRGVTRSTCFVLRPDVERYFFAVMTLAAEATVAYAAAHSSGSTIPYAKWSGVLEAMPTIVPTRPVAAAFDLAVGPLIEQARALVPQTRVLEALRNLLLPKLVTGQIDVSELDLDAVAESVA